MRLPVTLVHLINMIPNKCSRVCVHGARLPRIACFLAACIVTLSSIGGIPADGQEMPAIAAMQTTIGSSADENGSASTASSPYSDDADINGDTSASLSITGQPA